MIFIGIYFIIVIVIIEHVLKMFKNLKINNKQHEESFGVATYFVKKLQIQNLSIPHYLLFIPILNTILTKDVVI